MKKLLSLLLVMLVLIPAIASVGASADVYVNEDPYYSFAYPDGWQAIDKDTVDTLIDLGVAANQNNIATVYLDMVKQMGIVMFASPDMTEFAIVIAQEIGVDMPASQLVSLLPIMSQQVMGSADGAQVIADGEVMTTGENSFAKIVMTIPSDGATVTTAIYLMASGGTLLVPCYFNVGEGKGIETFERALASFSAKP